MLPVAGFPGAELKDGAFELGGCRDLRLVKEFMALGCLALLRKRAGKMQHYHEHQNSPSIT